MWWLWRCTDHKMDAFRSTRLVSPPCPPAYPASYCWYRDKRPWPGGLLKWVNQILQGVTVGTQAAVVNEGNETKPIHGRSHRSGWSGFNRTTFQKESSEYSITTTHLIACFVCMQSICYLGVADMCIEVRFDDSEGVSTDAFWWALSSKCKVSISQTIVREIKTSVACALRKVIGSIAGHFHTTTKVKMLCLPNEFSALAVSCLEFPHALDLPESSSYSLYCCVWQCDL